MPISGLAVQRANIAVNFIVFGELRKECLKFRLLLLSFAHKKKMLIEN